MFSHDDALYALPRLGLETTIVSSMKSVFEAAFRLKGCGGSTGTDKQMVIIQRYPMQVIDSDRGPYLL